MKRIKTMASFVMRNRFILISGWSLLFLVLSPHRTITAQTNHRQNFRLEYLENGYVGSYEIEPKRYLLIGLSWGGDLSYLDTGTGLFGKLERLSESVFVDKERLEIKFERETQTQIKRIEIQESGLPGRFAKAYRLRFEDLRIPVDGATLAATLVLPVDNAPFPLIIISGGASWVVRDQLLEEALLYASNGIASLIYDKRGFGESTGEQTVPFAVSANDIVSMVSLLKLRSDVTPTKVGISTYSQSGWYGTLAASQSADISFLILNVSPATTVYRQEFLRVENELWADGFPETDIEEAMSFMHLMSQFSITGEGWEDYLASRERGSNKEWFRYVFAPTSKNPEMWKWGRMNWEYNPLPFLQKIVAPTLVILGEMDKKVLPEVNRAIFEMTFTAAGNKDFAINILPKMNHDLVASENGGRKEKAPNRLAPGLIKMRLDWLMTHLGLSY